MDPMPAQDAQERNPARRGPSEATVTAASYGVLVLFGLVSGVVGAFQHSWYLWPVPISAVGCVAVLFAACHVGGRMTGGKLGALTPAAAWLVVTMIWMGRRPEGDVVIADDLSSYVYLYGGLLAALVAVLLTPSTRGGSWLLTQRSLGAGPAGRAPGERGTGS
ncbi:DUF6113 family protein [Streptosporangium sp. NPDC004379]|uniref:DUF6113 family protein n=1 Tax=Streptosporangium sp. NPDC004379 TaxID=3366189 RepID=UPI0036BB05A9